MGIEKTWRPTSRNQTDPVPRSSLLTSNWYIPVMQTVEQLEMLTKEIFVWQTKKEM